MKKHAVLAFVSVLLLSAVALAANPSGADPSASSSTTTSPHVIRFSGTLSGSQSALVGIRFSLYKDQTGGSPLWQEVQNVKTDENGHYSVLLGSTQPDGVPSDLFSNTDARWLGVQVEGAEEQNRVQLVSVPYALHAADAETLGGKPLSAFVLSGSPTASPKVLAAAPAPIAPSTPLAADLTSSTGTANQLAKWTDSTTLGNSILFDDGTHIGINTTTPQGGLDVNAGSGSVIFRGFAAQVVSPINNGPQFAFTNAATPTHASWRFGVPGSANSTGFFIFDFVNQTSPFFIEQGTPDNTFRLQAAGKVGIGTASPSSKLTVAGTVESTSGGFKFPDGTVLTTAAFASTQGTITGVTAGTALTGGGTSGSVTLNVDTTKVVTGVTAGTALTGGGTGGSLTLNVDTSKVVTGVTAGTGLTGGGTGGTVTLNVDATKVVGGVNVGTGLTGGGTGGIPTVALDQTFTDGRYAKLSGGNTFVGNQAVTGSVTATGQISGNSFNTAGKYYVGGYPVIVATTNSTVANLFMGDQAGNSNTTGNKNLFDGALTGLNNTTGSNNTFVGTGAGEFNTVGNENTFIGYLSGENNYDNTGTVVTDGNTYVGANAGLLNKGTKNVYLGHDAGIGEIAESNTMRLGSNSEVSDTYVAGVYGSSVDNATATVALVDSSGKLGSTNTSTTGVTIAGVYGSTIDNSDNSGVPVQINSKGQLGVTLSSRRFKENITPMGDITEGLFKLRPVTFYYKSEYDKSTRRFPQYGLIAEEVAKVYPDLVVFDKEGKPYTVKYQYLTPMLLNEVQKQHATIADQASVIQSQTQKIRNLEQRLERLEKLLDRSVASADTQPVNQP